MIERPRAPPRSSARTPATAPSAAHTAFGQADSHRPILLPPPTLSPDYVAETLQHNAWLDHALAELYDDPRSYAELLNDYIYYCVFGTSLVRYPRLYAMSDAVRQFKAALPRPSRKGKGKGKGAATKAVDDAQCEADSPEKVDNRQWATGRKFAYLMSHLEGWKDAADLTQVSNFYDNVTVRWIAMWGWSLPVETDAPPDVEDPSAEVIEAIFKVTEESRATEEAQRRRAYFWHLRGVRSMHADVTER